MNQFGIKVILILLLLSYVEQLKVYSQDTITITLKRHVVPRISFNEETDKFYRSRNVKYSEILAGDYSKDNTRFTLALDPSINCRTIGYRPRTLYVAQYKIDTIYIGNGITKTTSINSMSVYLKANGKEYKVLFDESDTLLKIVELHVNNLKPDLKLFENRLPDIDFPLLEGGKVSFTSFTHKIKLIYVEFWNDTNKVDVRYMDSLKKVFNNYSNHLTIISLVCHFTNPGISIDTNLVKKIVKEHKFDWIHGISNEEINSEFLGGDADPYGVLFDNDGKVIKIGLMPWDLKKYCGHIGK